MTLLFVALVVINAASVWVIVASRRSAESLARQDLRLQTTAHAKSLEAVLSSRRGDFIFLAQSPALANAPTSLATKDPIARRWSRLDIEGSLLLYMAAHPEMERLVIRDSKVQPLVAVGRRRGAPVLLPAREYATPLRSSPGYLVGEWKLGAEDGLPGELETVVNISELLKVAAPGMGPQFSLIEREIPDPSGSLDSADSLVVCIPVRDEGWPSPVHWTLVCKQHPSGLLQSVTALAGRYRTTVILNMIIMSVALVLGVVTFQQVRRTAALEAENQQQARVRELERQVLHNERLASVGRLAAGMAHEINNPLEGMTNYLGLLEDDLQSQSATGSLELVTRVREGLDRVAGIIGQVLVFSDPGYSPLLPLDLKDVLNETVSFVRTNPSFRRTAVVLNTCPEDVSVLGNRVTLGQLFLNLLMNASQLQPEGGQIEVGLVRERKHAIVLVADCGPGIPADVLPRIFEPFYSTRGSTGLGLSVCHGIVTEHRGRIWAENRPEGGAIFFIQFPLYTGETAESEAESSSTVAGFSTHGGVRT